MHPRRTEINYEIKELLKTAKISSACFWVMVVLMFIGFATGRVGASFVAVVGQFVFIGYGLYCEHQIAKLRKESNDYADRYDDGDLM